MASVEDALRMIRCRAAMLSWVSMMADGATEEPPPYALEGVSDVCDAVSELAARVMASLDGKSLNLDLLDVTETEGGGDRPLTQDEQDMLRRAVDVMRQMLGRISADMGQLEQMVTALDYEPVGEETDEAGDKATVYLPKGTKKPS